MVVVVVVVVVAAAALAVAGDSAGGPASVPRGEPRKKRRSGEMRRGRQGRGKGKARALRLEIDWNWILKNQYLIRGPCAAYAGRACALHAR